MINQDQRRKHRQFHDRLRAMRGCASDHPCVDCCGPAKEWSWEGGSIETYGDKVFVDDFDQYVPRCQSCHRRKDGTGFTHTLEAREKMRVAKMGKPLSEAHREAIRQGNKGKKYPPERVQAMVEGRKRAQALRKNKG